MTRILIVDDSFISRQTIANVMSQKQITDVDTARNGVDALAMIEASHKANRLYDIVFIDRTMPQMEGMDVVRRIRARKDFDLLSFIMITAEAKQSEILDAVKAGVSAYLVKPVSIELVASKFDEIMQNHRQRGATPPPPNDRDAIRQKYDLPPKTS